MVWCIAKYMVKSLFIAGHEAVILDATNTTKQRRDEWKSKEWVRRYVGFHADKDECIRRAVLEGDIYIIPIIEKMAAQFQDVDDEELDANGIG